MNNKDTDQLLQKYLSGKCSPAEELLIEKWLDRSELTDNAWSMMDTEARAQYELNIRERLRERLIKDIQTKPVAVHKLWPRIAIAASMFFVVGAGVVLYTLKSPVNFTKTSVYGNDVAPGKNTATLTLADGSKVVLSDAANGQVTEQAGIVISKTNDGQLIYTIKDAKVTGAAKYNTLSTANGEQYKVRLPDGSTVWLNAGTSLTYPATFSGLKERSVELIGEAYFEVAKDKIHPFVVKTAQQEVRVLGTHFNLTAYPDEKLTKTTLIEGKVKVIDQLKSGKEETTLNPGQQMWLSQTGGYLVSKPDLEEITAWKDGYFKFSESLESIMTKVARWYDVEIIYQDNFNGKLKFVGKISRTKNLSAILDIIESASNIHFKIEGRRVTVMK